MSRSRLFLLCGLTALLYSLSLSNNLEGFQFGALAWVSLIPLHIALEGATSRQAFWRGWLTGLLAFVGTVYWVITAMHQYGQVPIMISLALMVLLATYLGLYIGLYALGVVWLEQKWGRVTFLVAPCLWVSLEFLRTHLLSGFPWGLLGYSQFRFLPVIQFADITGVYGVSFLIVVVNLTVFLLGRRLFAARSATMKPSFPWPALGTALASLAIVLAYGYGRLDQEAASITHSRMLQIGLVQANIDQSHKWDPEYRIETMNRYERLTAQVAPGMDLIIWPEAATPFLFEKEPAYQSLVISMVQQADASLVFGSPTLWRHADGRPYLFNSAYLLNPSGETTGRYDKQHLVPFGEYIPLRQFLSFLDKLVVGIGDFEPGATPTLLTLSEESSPPNVRFGVAICFEVIFPDLVRELAWGGANFLVTVTNDAWFGDTVAPYQHFAMTVLRAVENRLAFARAANTGISGFIAPDGRILQTTPIFTENSLTGAIPLRAPSTFYTRFGDMFAWACVIITTILLLFVRFFHIPGAIETIFKAPTQKKGVQDA